ncbi:hypothetical protein [Jannaschia sp. 2305UL9-9]|uniref:hypothetical protein n=1 Tax=Jannaschia sp. 2305UL9-9 TaxID=3121638 RepID=UPI003529A4CC
MSRQDFEADWTPFRDALRTRFPELSETDMSDADGDVRALALRLSAADGSTPAEAEQRLTAFLSGPMPADAYAAPQHDGAAFGASGDYVPDGEDVLADDARFGDDDQADRPIGRRDG